MYISGSNAKPSLQWGFWSNVFKEIEKESAAYLKSEREEKIILKRMKENPRQSIGLLDAEDHKSWISDIKTRVHIFFLNAF